jgi:hypothetical protein
LSLKPIGDLKDNGFDFERSALRHFLPLSRLTLAVCLPYVWFLAFGTELVKHSLHPEVDRADHRNLSLFRIAWDYLQRALLFAIPFDVLLAPFFGFLHDFHPCGW